MYTRYKGMYLDPKAFELKDGTGWSADVGVYEDAEGEIALYPPIPLIGQKYETEELAVQAAIQTGIAEVDKRLKSQDIRSVIEQETQLPTTHRSAFGSHSDDVAMGADGKATKVPAPENPEDRFR